MSQVLPHRTSEATMAIPTFYQRESGWGVASSGSAKFGSSCLRVWGAQAGLEDWELSKIRVNLLQKADASDLLERLSMLQPLPSLQQSAERSKLEGLFSRSSAQRAGMQRWGALTPPKLHCCCIVSLHSNADIQMCCGTNIAPFGIWQVCRYTNLVCIL